MTANPFEVHVGLTGHSKIDFDRRQIRRVIRIGARMVQRDGRKLASRREGAGRTYRVWGDMLHRASAAGAPPTKVTGQFQRSLDTRVVGQGFAATIGPNLSRAFYARFLAGGTQDMAKRPVMDQALERNRQPIASMLESALLDSMVPR